MAREPETRDLMFQDEIKDTVRRAYGAIETGGGEAVARRLYSEEELAEMVGLRLPVQSHPLQALVSVLLEPVLAEVPPGAVSWALGVGNPVRYAFLQPGETVLDIGSGGGIDTILAARRVGHEGAAIGLDVVYERLGAHSACRSRVTRTEPMPRNPASRAGQSSSRERWRTSPSRTGQWTS